MSFHFPFKMTMRNDCDRLVNFMVPPFQSQSALALGAICHHLQRYPFQNIYGQDKRASMQQTQITVTDEPKDNQHPLSF